jgi:hypothetical protein
MMLPENGSVRVYPGNMPIFSFARAINWGLRTIAAGVLVVGGIDAYYPAAALAEARDLEPGNVLGFKVERVADMTRSQHVEQFMYHGGLVAMHAHDWRQVCGYDERCVGWGAEDTDLWRRATAMLQGKVAETVCYDIDHDPKRGIQAGWRRDAETNYLNGCATNGADWHKLEQAQRWGLACA